MFRRRGTPPERLHRRATLRSKTGADAASGDGVADALVAACTFAAAAASKGHARHPGPDQRRVAAISALKRWMTAGNPSKMLWPIRKWPMLTSETSGIAAIGPIVA